MSSAILKYISAMRDAMGAPEQKTPPLVGGGNTPPKTSETTNSAPAAVDWETIAAEANAKLPPGAVIPGRRADLNPVAIYDARRAQIEEAGRHPAPKQGGAVSWDELAAKANAKLKAANPHSVVMTGQGAFTDPHAIYAARRSQTEGGR